MNSMVDMYKDAALAVGLGRRYGRDASDEATTDCISFQYEILRHLYGDLIPGPGTTEHRILHLNTPDGLFSFDNVHTLHELGVVARPEIFPHGRQQLLSPGVYYCQAWDQAGQHGATRTRGHTFALLVTDSVPWSYSTYPPVHILEATNSTRDRDEDGTEDQFDWYRAARYPDVLSRWDRVCFAQLINPYALEKDDG